MIVYALTCAVGHHFDAWFRDSGAFDGERRDRKLVCPICGDGDVRKAPMAPHVARGGREAEAPQGAVAATSTKASAGAAESGSVETFARLVTMLRRHVETTCEDVGERFAEEARRIHYGECESRGIYGEASAAETSELRDEGIAVQPLPWFVRRND